MVVVLVVVGGGLEKVEGFVSLAGVACPTTCSGLRLRKGWAGMPAVGAVSAVGAEREGVGRGVEQKRVMGAKAVEVREPEVEHKWSEMDWVVGRTQELAGRGTAGYLQVISKELERQERMADMDTLESRKPSREDDFGDELGEKPDSMVFQMKKSPSWLRRKARVFTSITRIRYRAIKARVKARFSRQPRDTAN
mmetsp:Transcript_23809/g.37224  ORF Transcript_23809/g.37224 Transcript_23809/m.37224 type:complete len:194 (+) Transcript_23809:1-582(+)